MDKEKLIQELTKEVDKCQKCPLYKSRKNPLTGDGNINSKTMLIGEAPGYEEDIQKKAFVGRAGKILDYLLETLNLTRNDVYITNIVKCKPPENRDPEQKEIITCFSYLVRQLKIIKPITIICLGKYACQEIFKLSKLPFSKISSMHGKSYKIKTSYGHAQIIASYHPAAALHNPNILKILKEDFKKIKLCH